MAFSFYMNYKNITVGVLALQGGFQKHQEMLEQLGAETVQVRTKEDLEKCDGLILPGGESTTMTKLIEKNNLFSSVQNFCSKKPVLGTCAGAILLSKNADDNRVKPLQIMDFKINRNAYGRQVDSFITPVKIVGLKKEFEAIFIRAPKIILHSPPLRKEHPQGIKEQEGVLKVLATYNNEPIFVQQNNKFAMSFHPELTDDARIHEMFLESV